MTGLRRPGHPCPGDERGLIPYVFHSMTGLSFSFLVRTSVRLTPFLSRHRYSGGKLAVSSLAEEHSHHRMQHPLRRQSLFDV